MHTRSTRNWIVVLACALSLLVVSSGSAVARPTNDQAGLVNVNLQEVAVQVPVSIALPIGLAANVCNVSVIELDETGDTACTASSNSKALSRAVANNSLGTGSSNGGGARNNQAGLVNVNIQDLALQIPVSVAVPVSVAANVCNISVIELNETGATSCDAESASMALSRAVATALLEQ